MVNVVKRADKSYLFCGLSNRIKYSIIVTNTGECPINCVKVKDVLAPGMCVIAGSITVDGCCKSTANLEHGITIGSISPGGNTIVTFDVEVAMHKKLKQIENQAKVLYCDEKGTVETVYSNKLIVPVYKIWVGITKMSDKKVVYIGEVITYTLLVRNESNIPIDDVIIYDILPQELRFLPGTVISNSENSNIEEGINIGTLQPYSGSIVSFQVQVISYPTSGIIENSGIVKYAYTIHDGNTEIISTGEAWSCMQRIEVINQVMPC